MYFVSFEPCGINFFPVGRKIVVVSLLCLPWEWKKNCSFFVSIGIKQSSVSPYWTGRVIPKERHADAKNSTTNSILLQFCSNSDLHMFQQILRKWKKISLKKENREKTFRDICKKKSSNLDDIILHAFQMIWEFYFDFLFLSDFFSSFF